MTLAQIDQQIAKWKQLQSNLSIKLVDLDEMPTYVAIRGGLYQGATAIVAGEMGGAIDAMWATNALWNEAFAKALASRAHAPLPWERERWLRDLEAKLLGPVMAVPSGSALDPTDALTTPTLSLGQALTEIVDAYDRVLALIHRIDARLGELERKVEGLNRLAESLGERRLGMSVGEIGDEARRDPLGISLDSFATVEARLRRLTAEIDERSAVSAALDRGEARIRDADRLAAQASVRAERCMAKVGQATAIPRFDAGDLLEWARDLRSKLSEVELSSMKIGLSRWETALESRMRPLAEADQANRDLLDRYQEVVGRFSAAQAQATGTRHQTPQAERIAGEIRAGLARVTKDVETLERDLVAYERLIRG